MSNLGINSMEKNNLIQERHLLLMYLAIVLLFVACVFPYSIQVFAYGGENIVGCVPLVSNWLVNPIVYVYGHYLERRPGSFHKYINK